ncbi:MAG: UDP-N-acetylmuramoyl-tripeptide--D-alanyl-D-alanine ligase [Deltaproteobacteria bacterium]|nr:UDP-N-acetylmuramoyl-tripeptide--D-alanyl-D-alanine ligase [Deltaproteobacteria bacterium]
MKLKLNDIVMATKGASSCANRDELITGVSTDSRSIVAGTVFFALKGPRFDGHAFVRDVLRKGAVAAVVKEHAAVDLAASLEAAPLIVVKDTLASLGNLASYVRRLHGTPVAAISGTAGKTTTKEMLAAILKRSRRVLKTEGNKNNLIGLPLTLMELDESFDAAVVELGISEFYEMQRLVEICVPDVAVITNIGRAHLATLGDIEGVARAKAPLFTALPPTAVRVVNLDDPRVVKSAQGGKNIVTYSLNQDADVRARKYTVDKGFESIEVIYDVRGAEVKIRFPSPSMAYVVNGAAALAAALPFGAKTDEMIAGLNGFQPIYGRMSEWRSQGVTLLDDTYNANPESVASALRTLALAKGRRVAVIGAMLELGEAAVEEHAAVGRMAASLGIDMLVTVGALASAAGRSALEAGMNKESVLSFKDNAAAGEGLKEAIESGDTVLVKGSRGALLEEVAEGIKRFVAGDATRRFVGH